jgi:hypothetical protein
VATAAFVIWRRYISLTWADFDGLLVFSWVLMVALGAWRVDIKRDALLAAVAFGGGAIIETWGTRSGLWTYFTHETPPLFILPAWPFAAIATERISHLFARATTKLSPRTTRGLEMASLAAFCILLARWTKTAWGSPWTWLAFGCVAVICLSSAPKRGDLARFAAGSILGYLLEYWGTTRECWTYYDGLTPPLTAVLSHGFATVAFGRVAYWASISLTTLFPDESVARTATMCEPAGTMLETSASNDSSAAS